MDLFQFLQYPFMQRALIAGMFLGILLAGLGIFVTLRKMAFFGEGIAHASLAGIAIAILTGFSPLPVAIVWAILLALLIFILEQKTKLPIDTVIGIFFTSAMALGVILMNFTSGYQPELLSFLFGSILSVSVIDLWIIAILTILILTWLIASRRQLTFLSLSEEQAIVSGIPVRFQTAVLYVALSIATVLGVKILGIILVSALIIIPPAISRLHAKSFRAHMILAVLFSEIIIVFGLALSFFYDLPSGATIVLVGAFIFLISFIFSNK
ncbi:metal ABC transporter permease [Candidatus Uhrbacteria bacterium]|nr:metal ABC transporter permease [Candidatus Uhrbacteria bacterium]